MSHPTTLATLNDLWYELPRPARMVVAVSAILLAWKFLPVDAIAVLFFWVVIVGGLLAFMIGALTEDGYHALKDFMDKLRQQSREKAQSVQETLTEARQEPQGEVSNG